jgi:acylphosphatase
MKCCRAVVAGKVQGVGFRYSAASVAARLRLGGWIRNMDNGDVVTECEGKAENVDAFIKWLKKGPQYARVDSVNLTVKEYKGLYARFSIEGGW